MEKKAENPDIERLYGAPLLWDYFNTIDPLEAYTLGVNKAMKFVHTWGSVYNRDQGTNDLSILQQAQALGWLTLNYDHYSDGYPCDASQPTPDWMHDYYPQSFIRNPDGSVKKGWYGANGQMYFRSSRRFLTIAQDRIPGKLTQYRDTMRYLDVVPQRALEENWDTAYPGENRTFYLDRCLDLLNYLRTPVANHKLVITGETGKWWAVPYLDVPMGLLAVLRLPYPSDRHPEYYRQTDYNGDGIDETTQADWDQYESGYGTLDMVHRIPLWELVFHDCTVDTWRSDNQSVDWTARAERAPQGTPFPFSYQQKKDAITVLYGGVPGFIEVIWYGDMQRTQAGAWRWHRVAFMRSYVAACKLHEKIAQAQMVSHEFLTADRQVQKTAWSDGTQVVVNFGSAGYWHNFGTEEWYYLTQNDFCAEGPGGFKAARTWNDAGQRSLMRVWSDGYYYNEWWEAPGSEVGLPVSLEVKEPGVLKAVGYYEPNWNTDGSITMALYPRQVDPTWDIYRTCIYECDNKTGQRTGLVANWQLVSYDGILVGPFYDWTILELVQAEIADFDVSCAVDILDLQLLSSQWLDDDSLPDWTGQADLDHSGKIDMNDFTLLAQEWLQNPL